MDISRYLVIRILAISAAILIAVLLLATWRAQADIESEEIGAREALQLFQQLRALEHAPRGELEASVRALQQTAAAGRLRHLRLDLDDGAQHAPAADASPDRSSALSTDASPDWLQHVFARIAPGLRPRHDASSGLRIERRDDGAAHVATLSLNPASEQREALDNLLGVIAMLLVYGAAMLLAVYWTLRRALAPLHTIVGAMEHYGRDDFAYRVPALPFREMDMIGRALNRLAGTLDAAQRERRALNLKLVSSQDDERARIARELHDELAQSLTAMRADTAWLLRTNADLPAAQTVLEGLAAQCEHVQLGVRDLLSRLRAPLVSPDGSGVPLQAMLGDLIHGWSSRPHCAIAFTLHDGIGPARLPDAIATTVYRLSQEALTNAVRHAHADTIEILLARTADGALQWSVIDDGIGIEAVPAAMQRGNGLAGMSERVWALGSDLEIGPARPDRDRPGLRLSARFTTDPATH